jgi:hypothetical protein
LSPKYNRQNYQNNSSRSTQTQVGDTQLNQNSATVSHVNRDNFKLNAVYDVKIDTVNTQNYYQNKFYTADSDEFTTVVPLAAMACCETNKSVCLLLIQIKQRFCQRFV